MPASATSPESLFIRTVFGDGPLRAATKMQVVGIDPPSPRTWVMSPEEIEAFLNEHRDNPGAVCYCPAFFDSKQDGEAGVSAMAAFVFDFDAKELIPADSTAPKCRPGLVTAALAKFNGAEKIIGKATACVISGYGVHGIWVPDQIVGVDDASRLHIKNVIASVAKKVGADPASATLSHYYRLPGTLNTKHGASVRAKLLACRPQFRTPFAALEKIARPLMRRPTKALLRESPACLKEIRPFHILRRLREADLTVKSTRKGGPWKAQCPAHEDSNPSLSIRTADDGTARVKCFAGCDRSTILAELGIAQPAAETDPRQGVATAIMAMLKGAELFHGPDGTAYATLTENGHIDTWRVESKAFETRLSNMVYKLTGKAASKSAIADGIAAVVGQAQCDGPEREVFIRVGRHDGRIYWDLANTQREVVEITDEGWRVTTDCPIRFLRQKGMAPLPTPEPGGTIDLLRPILNAKDEKTWVLSVGWLVGALNPDGPFPPLALHGPNGSGKTTMQEMLLATIDPNSSGLRFPPRSTRDLVIGASNSWGVGFDNLSYLTQDLADAFCRIATGAGFCTRALYTGRDEEQFRIKRPLMWNGIPEVAMQPDLLDRVITIYLPKLDGHRSETQLWADFNAVLARVLGALCDAVSHALRTLPSVNLPKTPRLVDFARFVTAAEGAFGWKPGTFLEAYEDNRREGRALALEASPIVTPLRKLLDDEDSTWVGTATQLLAALEQRVDEKIRRQPWWPTSAVSLSNALRRVVADLESVGITVHFDRSAGGKRQRLIYLNAEDPPEDPDADPPPTSCGPPMPLIPDPPRCGYMET